MIPRRAFFYWSGGEMPWIRKKCIESFMALNPDWQVDLYGDDNAEMAVKRSDVFRYEELAANGGWYFDTDILFVKPMDALLEDIGDADTVICYNDTIHESKIRHMVLNDGVVRSRDAQFFYSVASLACEAGNPFYARAAEVANKPEVFNDPDSQSCGVWMFHHIFGLMDNFKKNFPDLKFYVLPRESFLPMNVPQSRTLYRDTPAPVFKDGVYGVHWYGGDASGSIADGWDETNYWANSAIGRLIDSPTHV